MKKLLLATALCAVATPALALFDAPTPGWVYLTDPTTGNLIGSASHPMNVTGTFSASFAGFQPTPSYSTLAVGVSSARVALPSGTVVIVYNTGANAASVTLGTVSVTATGTNDIIQPNSWMAFTVGANGYLATMEATGAGGTSSLVISGGAGLPTGSGGGGGGGSGSNSSVGNIGSTAPTSGTYEGMLVSGGNMVGVSGSSWGAAPTGLNVLGVNANVLTSALPSGAATLTAQTTGNTALTTINTTLGSPMQNSGGTVIATQATAANLNMTCANCSSSGVSAADNAGFTAGTTVQAAAGAVATSAPTAGAVTTGHQGAVGMSLNREQWIDAGPNSGILGAINSSIPAGSNLIGKVGIDQTTPGTTNAVALTASSNIVGKVGIDQTTPGTTNGVQITNADVPVNHAQVNGVTVLTGAGATGAGAQRVTIASDSTTIAGSPNSTILFAAPAANAGAGASQTGNIAANNTTAITLKASSGTLYSLELYGLGSAPAYLKLYNATSVTCGSATPVARYMIPAASSPANGAGSNITLGAVGVSYTSGITYCVTTGILDSDTTAPAASTFLINAVWK